MDIPDIPDSDDTYLKNYIKVIADITRGNTEPFLSTARNGNNMGYKFKKNMFFNTYCVIPVGSGLDPKDYIYYIYSYNILLGDCIYETYVLYDEFRDKFYNFRDKFYKFRTGSRGGKRKSRKQKKSRKNNKSKNTKTYKKR